MEAYAVAVQRVAPRNGKPERDFVVGLRYVDDLERRADEWRILSRVCTLEWTRRDEVLPGWTFPDDVVRGQHSTDDVVFASR
jgi:hypothetical protein